MDQIIPQPIIDMIYDILCFLDFGDHGGLFSFFVLGFIATFIVGIYTNGGRSND